MVHSPAMCFEQLYLYRLCDGVRLVTQKALCAIYKDLHARFPLDTHTYVLYRENSSVMSILSKGYTTPLDPDRRREDPDYRMENKIATNRCELLTHSMQNSDCVYTTAEVG